MKKILVLVAALVLVSTAAFAAATVVGSAHDMRGYIADETSTQVCVYCHTPHQSTGNNIDPLWNHNMSAQASYGVYASTTLNAVPTDIGGGTGTSNLCMSCHDGTIAVNSLFKAPLDGTAGTLISVSGSALLGTDLSNDHPINFTYNAALATADGGLVTPNSANFVDAGGTIPLYAATVQCATCHAVHDPSNAPFLRVSNANSALCTACHNK